jgi:hypothetical protein
MSFSSFSEPEIPEDLVERARMLEQIMIASCTGGSRDETNYKALRTFFIQDELLKSLLPSFVRTSRTLQSFWSVASNFGTYAERRQYISDGFTPLFDHLEGHHQAPVDHVAGEVLQGFDADSVHATWTKALQRRHQDPEGAITLARTLLESVCKTILDRHGVPYNDSQDLPKLYGAVSRLLQLAPSQHTEEAFRSILGGAHTVINGLGTLRNRLSDAHGRGGQPVRPSPRHASLAVNMAGAVATFLVETELARAGRTE